MSILGDVVGGAAKLVGGAIGGATDAVTNLAKGILPDELDWIAEVAGIAAHVYQGNCAGAFMRLDDLADELRKADLFPR